NAHITTEKSKMDTTRKPFGSKPRLSALTLALSLAGVSAIAHADALSDLKAQIEALQRKAGELDDRRKADEENRRKAAAQAAPGNAVTGGATQGPFKL